MGKAAVKVPVKKQVIKNISVDITEEDVLKWNEAGHGLIFESDIGQFKALPEKVVNQLSHVNTRAYWVSYTLHKQAVALEEAGGPAVLHDIRPSPTAARATTRLEVQGKQPNMHYEYMLPQELQLKGYQGWRPSTDPRVKTFCKTPGGSHQLISPTEPGTPEQVLMEIPKETFAEIDQIRKDTNELARTGKLAEGKFERDAAKDGVRSFIPDENDGHAWREESGE